MRRLPTLCRPSALLWLAAAGGLISCSLLLDFNPDGLPCDVANGQACLAGYSCNAPSPNTYICIADGALKKDAPCQLDRQCHSGLLCPSEVGTCVAPCPIAAAYVAGSPNCPTGEYCRPTMSTAMFSDGQVHAAQRVTACVPSDNCTPGAPCDSSAVRGGSCADMKGASACVIGCEVTFAATTYRDNCGADALGNPRFCQALGPGPGYDVLACLDAGPTPQAVGSPCGNPVAQPCAPGLGCIRSICQAYTPLSNVNSCTPGLTPCDLHVNANTLVGYCSSDPSCPQ